MAEKFPPIQDLDSDVVLNINPTGGNFLEREKQLLGDQNEFITDNDINDINNNSINNNDDTNSISNDIQDDEINQFQSQFPELNDNLSNTNNFDLKDLSDSENEFSNYNYTNNHITTTTTTTTSTRNFSQKNESKAIIEWRINREKELAKKDAISSNKKNEILENAHNLIDQFYENYNKKKEININKTKNEELDFLEKREIFNSKIENNLVWNNIISIIDLKKNSNTTIDNRDRSKFKSILLSLKDNKNAPPNN
ncbi:clathrin light chain CLC1 ASCRUDRAFT_77997 [Ascoidea rubescens DSM 1968]|uniref:Clathrin light chain n=1 Tax=Ascoidea rubescens DSM 1968 TaxID=1344418 RepID=A0A1D2V9H9_9ASCO|nr:hypothetical protein ASCRUDRAFT_77997 [Ascoidea rubescens DSM 1968]ODV58298.1 hypothetical protein ASCRUDRAFT_77997 [Ascoidea rubescens DSM 1968]